MILNRPTNLILAAFTALFNVVVLAFASAGIDVDPSLTAAVNLAAAAIIALIAGSVPPTLNPGDKYQVTTPTGEPTIHRVVTRRTEDGRGDDPPAAP